MSGIDKIISSIALTVILLLLLIAAIFVPAHMRAKANCIEKGYPAYSVTWNLRTCCMSLDGAVTVDVEEIQ